MLLMIDNYDSFTYNVVQYFGELGVDVQVFRNDSISIDEIEKLAPQQLVISPGPCTPNEAGISMGAISHFAGKIPILKKYDNRKDYKISVKLAFYNFSVSPHLQKSRLNFHIRGYN